MLAGSNGVEMLTKEGGEMNDWVCPYCKKTLYDGGFKLRHLGKHEPIIARLIRKELIQNITLGLQAWDRVMK